MARKQTVSKTGALTSTKRKSKFGNVRVVMDGIKHASKKQGMRWILLRQWERDGLIQNLKREVKYPIVIGGVKVCTYIADHVYEKVDHDFCGANVTMTGTVVEDVKGMKTPMYRLKKKLMKAVLNIDIQEV